MAPRRRSKAKRAFPDNLYEREGYYSWRNPVTREEFGIGRDRASAFTQAIEANLHIAGLRHEPRLIDRVTGSGERSVAAWCKKYTAMLERQSFAANTLRAYKSLTNRMELMLGAATPLARVTALQVSEGLDALARGEGKAQMAKGLRSFMRDSLREAVVHGWIPFNPVIETRLTTSVVVKRARLTFELFTELYGRARVDWLRNAMALALVSAQRREEVASAQFRDFREGGWWCEQGKTDAKLFIPLELRLQCFGMSLGEVVGQCRRSHVISKFLIHQTAARSNSPRGQRILLDTISKGFTALVASVPTDWGDKTPPTFHEIRSLSERLYKAQGGVNTQELLGHRHAATTALYDDTRGSEWTRVKVTV